MIGVCEVTGRVKAHESTRHYREGCDDVRGADVDTVPIVGVSRASVSLGSP